MRSTTVVSGRTIGIRSCPLVSAVKTGMGQRIVRVTVERTSGTCRLVAFGFTVKRIGSGE
jgi:hypothetical protein